MVGSFLAGAAGGATVEIVISAVDKFSGTIDKITKKGFTLNTSLKLAGAGIAAVATGMAAFGVASVQAAAQAETMERQFKKLTTNSDDFLVSLNRATHETVSNFDLMTSANKALVLGLEQSQLPEFFEKAAILGQTTGRTVTEAVEDITLGVGRQSKLILDNLGIMVNAEAAYESYAKKLGKTADELDDVQKKEAFLQATLQGMNETIQKNGLQFELGLTQRLQQAKKAFADLKVEVGKELMPTMTELVDILIENKDSWIELGKAAGTVIKGIASGIGWVIDKVGELGAKLGWALGTLNKAAGELLTGDFSGAKATMKKGAEQEKFMQAGYNVEDSMKYGGVWTTEEVENLKNLKTADEERNKQLLDQQKILAEHSVIQEDTNLVTEEASQSVIGLADSITKLKDASKKTSQSAGINGGSYAVTGSAAAGIHAQNLLRAEKKVSKGSFAELSSDAVYNPATGTYMKESDIKNKAVLNTKAQLGAQTGTTSTGAGLYQMGRNQVTINTYLATSRDIDEKTGNAYYAQGAT